MTVEREGVKKGGSKKGDKDKERTRVLSISTVEAGSVSPNRCHVSAPSRFSSARPVITVMDGWVVGGS